MNIQALHQQCWWNSLTGGRDQKQPTEIFATEKKSHSHCLNSLHNYDLWMELLNFTASIGIASFLINLHPLLVTNISLESKCPEQILAFFGIGSLIPNDWCHIVFPYRLERKTHLSKLHNIHNNNTLFLKSYKNILIGVFS